jgi:hypothetical protein
MDEFGRHYAKYNKLGTDRQIAHDITHRWNLSLKTIRVEWWLLGEVTAGVGHKIRNFR